MRIEGLIPKFIFLIAIFIAPRIAGAQENKTYTSLTEAFENKDKVYKLGLASNNFEEFPSDIIKLVELKELVLNKNNITNLPESIDDLQNLEKMALNLIQ